MHSVIDVFHSANGEAIRVHKTKPPTKYPFRQMESGDYFEVAVTSEVSGNLSSLCSIWGKDLGRRFQMRTLGSGRHAVVRVTRLK